jgi:phage shock protein A
MGLIERLTRLVRAFLNHQLDRAEDPERILEQITRDDRARLAAVRRQLREMIAQQRMAEADLLLAQEETATWSRRAASAVAADRDDLARVSLRRRQDSAAIETIYAQHLDTQRAAVASLKTQVERFEARVRLSESRKNTLIARHRRAMATQEIQRHLAGPAATDMPRIERQIRRTEAQAAATTELAATALDGRFLELDDSEIDRELEELKSRLAQARSGADLAQTALDDLAVLDSLPEARAIRSGLT